MNIKGIKIGFLILAVVLSAIPSQAEDTGSVSGKAVMAEGGAPVRGVVLGAENSLFEWPKKVATIAADGSFQTENLVPGTHYLGFQPNLGTQFCRTGVIQVEVTAGKVTGGLVFEVAEGCAIRGQVLDAAGRPAAGQQVIFQPMGPYYRTIVTSPQGRFLIGNLDQPESVYHLEVAEESGRRTGVDVGPVGRGITSEPVLIQLPEALPASKIRGAVVDSAGVPVAGVAVCIHTPQITVQVTDEQGRFETDVYGAGTFEVEVSKMAQVDTGSSNVGCTVIEGSPITVTAGQPADVRLTVQIQPYLQGRVVDENGQPVAASIQVFGAPSATMVLQGQDGQFVATRLPDGPFLLEFTKEGYIARVLEKDRDFQPDDHALTVTLRKGPLPQGQPIFAEVTGRPATEEEAGKMPFSEDVRRREDDYRRMAAADTGLSTGTTPAPSERLIEVRGIDGKPARQIYVQKAWAYDISNSVRVTPETAMPCETEPSQMIENPQGSYAVSPGMLIWASGSGKVFIDPETPNSSPINLQPAGEIRIRVVDENGTPVAGVAAAHPAYCYAYQSSNFFNVPKTDATGVLTFRDLAPTTYAYRLLIPQPVKDNTMQPPIEYPFTVLAAVSPGKTCEKTVVFASAESNTPEGLFIRYFQQSKDGRTAAAIPAIPDKRTRNGMATLIADYLDTLPGELSWEPSETVFVAHAIKAFELKPALPALQSLLSRWKLSQGTFESPGDDGEQAMFETLIALEGDRAVKFFTQTVADKRYSYIVRRDAVVALGRIGSEKSVAAYCKLRDAAYKLPGAPQPKTDPTHDEKMAEAIVMTFALLPGGEIAASEIQIRMDSATISEDYRSGTMTLDGPRGRIQIDLSRFGTEWLVTRIQPPYQTMP